MALEVRAPEMLWRIQAGIDALREVNREIKTRLGRLETAIEDLQVQGAGHSVRMHRMNRRLGRVEKRLDLADA